MKEFLNKVINLQNLAYSRTKEILEINDKRALEAKKKQYLELKKELGM